MKTRAPIDPDDPRPTPETVERMRELGWEPVVDGGEIIGWIDDGGVVAASLPSQTRH
jgi:gamma-glutamylcysteine synthetase